MLVSSDLEIRILLEMRAAKRTSSASAAHSAEQPEAGIKQAKAHKIDFQQLLQFHLLTDLRHFLGSILFMTPF